MLFAIAKFLKTTFYGLCFLIDGIFYSLISTFYQVFIAVSKVSLYNDSSDQIGALTERVYTILGIAMLFVVAYNIILLIINPDKASSGGDKSIQGIFKGFVISVVIITVLPPIFKYMSILQNDIIDSRFIEQMILGSDGLASSEPKTMGNNISTMIYATFYHPITSDGDAVSYEECKNDSSLSSSCSDFVDAYAAGVVENVGSFIKDSKLEDGLTSNTPTMEFLPLVSTIGGVVALLMFISYAFDVGIRVAKLAFLQIIAPIPVMLRITKPSGGVFSKWVSNIIKTYLSLFLRLITIYFSMYMIELLVSGFNSNNGGLFAGIGNVSTIVMLFTKLVLIFGVLLFAKEAPKLLEELIGSSGLGGGFMPKDIAKKLTGAPILGGAAAAAGALAGKGVGAGAGAAGSAWSALRNNARFKIGGKGAEGLTHMNVGAAAKQGAAKGFAGGGMKQFKKQGENVFSNTYGPGKKQGLLGGKSFGTKVDENYGKAYEKTVKKHAEDEANQYIDENIKPNVPNTFDDMNTLSNDYASANRDFAANSDAYKQAAEFVDNEAKGAGITLTPEERKTKINERLSQIAATTTNQDEKRAIESYLKRDEAISLYNNSVLSGNQTAIEKVKAEAKVQTNKAVQLEIENKGGVNAVITDSSIKSNLENNAKLNVSNMLNSVNGDISKLDLNDKQKKEINSRLSNLSATVDAQIQASGGIANVSLSTDEMNLVNTKVNTALNSKISEVGGVSNVTLSTAKQAILDSKQTIFEQQACNKIQNMVDQSFTAADEEKIRQEVLNGDGGILFSSSADAEQAINDRIKREKQNKFQEFTEKFFDGFVNEEKSKEHDKLAVEQMKEDYGDSIKEQATKEVLRESLASSTVNDYLFESEYRKEVENHLFKEKYSEIEKNMMEKATKDAINEIASQVEDYMVGCAEGTYSSEKDGKLDKDYNAKFKAIRDYASANIKTKTSQAETLESLEKIIDYTKKHDGKLPDLNENKDGKK